MKAPEPVCLSGPTCGLCRTRRWLVAGVRPVTGPHWRTLGVAATRVWAEDVKDGSDERMA